MVMTRAVIDPFQSEPRIAVLAHQAPALLGAVG